MSTNKKHASISKKSAPAPSGSRKPVLIGFLSKDSTPEEIEAFVQAARAEAKRQQS